MSTECRREQVTHGKLMYTIKAITDSVILNSTDSIYCQTTWSHSLDMSVEP